MMYLNANSDLFEDYDDDTKGRIKREIMESV